MQFSYSGDPQSSPLDLIRFTLGDTDPNTYLLSDGEISYLLSDAQSPIEAAYKGTLSIIAKLTSEVDYQIGPEKVSASQRLEHYKFLRKELSSRVTSSTAFPLMADPVGRPGSQPVFNIGMNDAPGSKNILDYGLKGDYFDA